MPGYVYILELSSPLGNESHQAKYYIGWAKNFHARFAHHCKGTGSAFTRAAVEKGIVLTPVVLIEGDRSLERRLKNQKNAARIVRRYQGASENLIKL